VDATPYVELMERQLERERVEGRTGLAERLARSGQATVEDYLRGCNAHLALDPPGSCGEPARYAIYLDVNSLYATSCEFSFLFLAVRV
jgi:hypothetical protein